MNLRLPLPTRTYGRITLQTPSRVKIFASREHRSKLLEVEEEHDEKARCGKGGEAIEEKNKIKIK